MANAKTAERVTDPVSPVSLPGERVVLRRIDRMTELLPEAVATGLAVTDFSLNDHRRIFAVILAMVENKSPIDLVLLAEYIGGSQMCYVLIASLIEGVVIERSHILYHVALVRKKSKLRQLERMGQGSASDFRCRNWSRTGQDIAALIREQLAGMENRE